jgi:5'-3' exonuclease
VITALIDADILAYQAAAGAEQPIKWDDDLWTLHASEEEAQAKFHDMVNGLMDKCEADRFVLVFSDSANWRKDVLPTYKSNRAGTRKPMVLRAIREWAMASYTFQMRPTLEGDDLIGIMATGNQIIKGDKIICSLDKDFKTIPGRHYNFGRDEFFKIDEEQAAYWHMIQTLTGDSTDGYTGCPGCGPKTAEKILAPLVPDDYWQAVVKAYSAAGLSEEEALVQARVARICRASDYDFKKKKVILWNPPVTNKLPEATTV